MSPVRILVSIASVLISGSLFAGAAQPYIPVEVDYVNMYASGYMLAARSSKNDFEAIGCAVSVNAEGASSGLCQAVDPDGNQITCRFYDNEFLTRAVHGISDYSFVGFGWDEFENCTSIRVSHRSFYLPKK
mgnify:CR=1 FL=1